MNKDNAKDFLPLVQALADGKTIQYRNEINGWIDIDHIQHHWDNPEWYRIKPDPIEFWVNIYREDGRGYSYGTFEEARQQVSASGKTIKVREILD